MLKAFADEVGFVRFQIESFNDFLDNRIQKIINEIGEIKPEVPEIGELIIKLGKVSIGEPTMREADGTVRRITPLEARLRDLSYTAPVYVEVTPVLNNTELEPTNVCIGELPVMVKSKICALSKLSKEELEAVGEDPSDPGGYFIINGTERVLVLVEEIASNRMILDRTTTGSYTELLRINSERNGYVQRHLLERKASGEIYISFANIRRLPIVALLKLLGLETDKDIIAAISGPPDRPAAELDRIVGEFYPNLYEVEVQTAREAMEFIATHLKIVQREYRKKRVETIIDKYLLPHLGQEPKNRKVKAIYLALAARKLVELALGMIPVDDIDHYANKRIKLSGDLLELQLRFILTGRFGLIARIKYNYQKMAKRGKLPPIQTIVEANVVTNQLASAMATGAWTGGRTGVSQRLERKNYIDSLSHLRLALSPLTSTQEHFAARELHPTHFGRFCPAETPEGPTIGLRKHLAIFAEITKGLPAAEKKRLLASLKLGTGPTDIYLDGTHIGHCADPRLFVAEVRKKRNGGLLAKDINIAYYPALREIRINTDSGRVRRPLIVIENGRPRLTEEHLGKLAAGELSWSWLIKAGVIEYLDAEEEDNAFIALTPADIKPGHNYLELTPLAMLGVSAALVVFPEHNRGDRVNYGAKMVGQAIGLYQSNFNLRADTKSNILINPQRPLVETDITQMADLPNRPIGQNIIIALASYQGYNMEDGIVFNKSSIERGLFRTMFFRVYQGEEKRYWGGQEDVIGIPEKDVRGYRTEADYARLMEDGMLAPETPVSSDDVLIGRTSPQRFLSANELMSGIANMRETSICLRHGESGIVDRVFVTETANGSRLVKVVVRDSRISEIGDKFASRHGQKGVIGLVAAEENMPFSSTGLVPDIILNPHSIPSRQTIGQLLEILAGKVAALSGKTIDATAFTGEGEASLRAALHAMGFRSDGKEVLYNGLTGEKYEMEIFTGILYYLKLSHMVADKLQVRARGPVTLLTRQPTEGKAKEGGLRLGEMEKDCLIAHGAVLTLKERFDSDKIIIPICKRCGVAAAFDQAKERNVCPLCGGTDVADIEMSYAFKLLLDELKTMLIYPKLKVTG